MRFSVAAVFLLGLASGPSDEHERTETQLDFSAVDVAGELVAPSAAYISARAGGAQDVAFARDRIFAGQVPRPETFTAEGLLARHDLVLPGRRRCDGLLCVRGAAVPARLPSVPVATHLVQLGFDTGLVMETYRRPPLNLVFVVDTSCSMAGPPLELVRRTLGEIAERLGPNDRASLVSFSDGARVLGRGNKAFVRALGSLKSTGATNLEAGLKLGFDVAKKSRRFDGVTRVVLLTDEQPNVGRTDAAGFMAIARRAAKNRIGMTTIGVGTHFGVEVATAVSSVRGGNLFFFPDPKVMRKTLNEELDTMMVELAYDLEVLITPSPGMVVVDVYGVPGEMIERTGAGVRFGVETLFASKNRGGIFLALAGQSRTEALAAASVSYVELSGRRRKDAIVVAEIPRGLQRGTALIDQHTTLERATTAYYAGGAELAYELVSGLAARQRELSDPTLDDEKKTVQRLLGTLARAANKVPDDLVSRRE